jgi:hypothetical protein
VSLRHRIATVQSSNPDLRIIGTNLGPTETPLTHIIIYPGIIAYEDTTPLIASDGAPITATGKGQWGQLYAVGRMY